MMTCETTGTGLRWFAAMTIGLVAACGGEADEAEVPETAPPAPAAAAPAASADTTGAAMWAHLQAAGYQDSWTLWPDKGRLYPGQQPHGAQLTTYLNDVAHQALMSSAAAMPDGAVIVKENFTPDGELAAVTVMMKRSGYNADHADWFFSKHLPDGSLDRSPEGMALEGRVPGCQTCHMGRQDNDYIFTGELGG